MRFSIKYKYICKLGCTLFKFVVEKKFQTFFHRLHECYDADLLIYFFEDRIAKYLNIFLSMDQHLGKTAAFKKID